MTAIRWSLSGIPVTLIAESSECVALQVGRETAKCLQSARNLFVWHTDGGRQQSVEAERVAFGLGEGGPLVQQGIGEQMIA
jgi:hypothetical protein